MTIDSEDLRIVKSRGRFYASLLRELERRRSDGSPSEAFSLMSNDDLWRELLVSVTYITEDSVTLEIDAVEEPVKRAASSVVAIIFQDRLSQRADGSWLLQPYKTLAEEHDPWCRDVRFAEFGSQFIAAHATGSVAGPDLIITALHAIDGPLDQYKFVFDLVLEASSPGTIFRSDQVFDAVEKVAMGSGNGDGGDWVLLRLSGNFGDARQPPRWRQAGKIGDGSEVFALGFPARLPMKYLGGALVTENVQSRTFKASLGGFDANSGSPVFSRVDGLVTMEGILVDKGGKRDFRNCLGCNQAVVAPRNWEGETIVRITEVNPAVGAFKKR